MSVSRQPFRRRVLLNTASTGLANGWAMVLTLASLPLLLHGLGPSGFGTWVLLQTFSAVNGWFSLLDLGLGTALTRAVAERAAQDDNEAVGRLVASGLALFAGSGAACAAVFAIVGPWLLPSLFGTPHALQRGLQVAIVLFAFQVLADLVTEGCEACLEGLQRIDLSRLADTVRRTLVAAATAIVAIRGGGLVGVAEASLVASMLGVGFATVMLRRRLPEGTRRPATADMRALLRYGRTVAMLRPLGVIQRTMDRLIVGVVLGPAAVTLVEIATQVYNGAEAVLSATSYAVVPSSSWLRSRGDATTLRELLETGTRYSLLATLPLAGVAAVLAGPLVRVWVGARYPTAPGLVVVALAFVALNAPAAVGSNILLGVGQAGAVLRAAAGAVAVNLAASVGLVHVVGVIGVFEGTLLSAAFLVPVLSRAVLHEVGLSVKEFVVRSIVPVLPPTTSAVAAAGIVVGLPLGDLPTLLLGALAATAAYVPVALRFSFQAGELSRLRQALARD